MSTAQTQTDLKKPIRPLTAYHLFFQLEREWIIQNIESPDDDSDAQVDDRPVGKELDAEMPTRYQNIHLSPSWYDSASGKRKRTKESDQKRKHRRSHGKISFQELSRTVASRWANLEEKDNETKMYCVKIAKRELKLYKEKVKVYKEEVAVLQKRNVKNTFTLFNTNSGFKLSSVSPEIASIARMSSESPAPSLYSQTGDASMIESPGVVSISMSGSKTFEVSAEFLPNWMRPSRTNLTASPMTEAKTRREADFSFVPLPSRLQEKEELFLKDCQKKARYSLLFNSSQTVPTPGSRFGERQADGGIEDVVFDSTMRDLDTRRSNTPENAQKKAIVKSENHIEPMQENSKKRASSDMSCENISPLQSFRDSFVQMEYSFTTDDAEMLLKALF